MNKKPYMCKKQIRPIAQGCVWQGLYIGAQTHK